MPDFKHLGTIELGNLSSKIVIDPAGRKCISLRLAEREVFFTVTQALLTREVLDAGLKAIARYTPHSVVDDNLLLRKADDDDHAP